MSLKLSNLMILSGFAPGPKFIGKKEQNVWNENSDVLFEGSYQPIVNKFCLQLFENLIYH